MVIGGAKAAGLVKFPGPSISQFHKVYTHTCVVLAIHSDLNCIGMAPPTLLHPQFSVWFRQYKEAEVSSRTYVQLLLSFSFFFLLVCLCSQC